MTGRHVVPVLALDKTGLRSLFKLFLNKKKPASPELGALVDL